MKFKFCGDADCPDWVLAEINNLSKLSSVKLKLLALIVAKGITTGSINVEKAEKLFTESKLDATIDLKASIACITYIITSTMRYNCDHNAMHSELQQLGLPREHSTSLKRIIDEHSVDITEKLRSSSLKVNPLEDVGASVDHDCSCVNLELRINGLSRSVMMTPYTLDVLLDNLKSVRSTMVELNNTPYSLH